MSKRFSVRFVLLSILFLFQSFANVDCRSHLHSNSSGQIPANITILEQRLTELNDEAQRYDTRGTNIQLSEKEVSEVLTQEKITYRSELEIRLVYLARLNALRTKVVEKLTGLYLFQQSDDLAELNPESIRKLLYSIILHTKIRRFDADSLLVLKRISQNITRIFRLKETAEELRSLLFQLQNAIHDKDLRYIPVLLTRIETAYGIKSKKTSKNKAPFKAVETVLSELDLLFNKAIQNLNKLNQETINQLSVFSDYAPSFTAQGFQKWVDRVNDRSYLDELVTLSDAFIPDNTRIQGCCGRPCGLSCPYLTRMDIPIPTLDNLPENPILAVYKTFLVFREMVPANALPFPARPSVLHNQLKMIRD